MSEFDLSVKYIVSILLIAVVLLIPGCERNPEPTNNSSVTDFTELSEILDISAVATSRIEPATITEVVQYGHVWMEGSALPTVENNFTELGKNIPATLQFSSVLSDLKANTKYKVRSYVRTNNTIMYGKPVEFATEADYTKRLVKTLKDSLTNRGFGYSFIVSRKNEIVGYATEGLQSRAIEAFGEKPVTLNTKMQIASMTKTLTAVAFLKLASEKGVKTTDKIIRYLPPKWAKGENIDEITFRDLLTHRSGITGLGDKCLNGSFLENYWYGLQSLIAKGVKTVNMGNQCYQNANYGLYRVLIPAMLGYQFSGDDMKDDQETQKIYEKYINENLLKKAGVDSKDILTNPAAAPTFGYDHPYTVGTEGFNPGDFRDVSGAYGIYLSANEAMKVYSNLFTTGNNTVLSPSLQDSVLVSGLGSYSAVMPQGKFSYHDGWWYNQLEDGKPKGFRSIWIKCPNDIMIVMFTNALRHGDGLFPIKSSAYADITSYVLWAFAKMQPSVRGGKSPNVSFHSYLRNPEPH
ncbi:beta-lactamase family protein [Dyadobacter flavalbus]|uniref:Beta-lactamase family protein n=1 Tax=Dyadobacter flavalbus TaxID=2579942 RepID=A0A5M8R197_9BACT|nr:serine hydrolase domain-containing protein [Dyadobacter flavalbus]KAA6439992.1 beta-lactamase family protein [Dyadobacter flavalbus]